MSVLVQCASALTTLVETLILLHSIPRDLPTRLSRWDMSV